ncbi:MAG: GDP-mannose 4,6-dehydratase [Candidatus Thermoplasmatota archaeon]
MRIFLTGTTGFIGSALAKKLKELNHEVYGLYRYVSTDGRYDFYKLEKEKQVYGDIREASIINEAIRKIKPDIVIHLAAVTPVSLSFITPIEVAKVNYIGTVNVADACLNNGAVMIHASTSEVYGGGASPNSPLQEDDTLKALSPYASSKIACENYIQTLGTIYDFKYVIARPFNTYGRANVGKRYYVVERAITQALTEKRIHLYNPEPIRDLLFRDDHVNFYIKCIENLDEAIGEAFNICTGVGTPIKRMADVVAKIFDEKYCTKIPISWEDKPDRPKDIGCLIGDNTKAKKVLGWQPKYTLEQGLRKAIEEWKGLIEHLYLEGK